MRSIFAWRIIKRWQQQHTTRAARNASDNVHLNTGIAQRATPAMVRWKVGPSSSGNAAVGKSRGPPQQQSYGKAVESAAVV